MARKETRPAAGFRPFADDASVETLGTLSIENGTTGIAIHGALDLTRDRDGLVRAERLKAIVDAIVEALRSQDLPKAVVEETRAPRKVRNPFA